MRGDPLPDMAGFHAQRCVEKYLKAVLAWHRVFFSKTHDLLELYALCRQVRHHLQLNEEDLRWLSDCAVIVRYPDKSLTVADGERALAIMDAVRKRIREAFTLG